MVIRSFVFTILQSLYYKYLYTKMIVHFLKELFNSKLFRNYNT